MAPTIGFRPTEEDARIIAAATRAGESTTEVIRRALRLLDREAWMEQARADAQRLADENLSDEPDAW
jgi:Arc/MetJ-type ribon-helix-helix transcriptional regulator